MKRTPVKLMKPLLVVKLEKAYAKYAAVRDSHPSTAVPTPAATSTAATATGEDAASTSATTNGDTKPVIPTALFLSPTKKVEHEKKLRASQHNYHKFLKLATTTLSEREIGLCPPPVITEIRARKQRVRTEH